MKKVINIVSIGLEYALVCTIMLIALVTVYLKPKKRNAKVQKV